MGDSYSKAHEEETYYKFLCKKYDEEPVKRPYNRWCPFSLDTCSDHYYKLKERDRNE